MKTWLEILSELLVNIAAAWFSFVFIETQLSSTHKLDDILPLMFRVCLGILSLFFAKYLREKTKARRKR